MSVNSYGQGSNRWFEQLQKSSRQSDVSSYEQTLQSLVQSLVDSGSSLMKPQRDRILNTFSKITSKPKYISSEKTDALSILFFKLCSPRNPEAASKKKAVYEKLTHPERKEQMSINDKSSLAISIANFPEDHLEQCLKCLEDSSVDQTNEALLDLAEFLEKSSSDGLEERVALYMDMRKDEIDEELAKEFVQGIQKFPTNHLKERLELYKDCLLEHPFAAHDFFNYIRDLPEHHFEEQLTFLKHSLKQLDKADKTTLLRLITLLPQNRPRECLAFLQTQLEQMDPSQKGPFARNIKTFLTSSPRSPEELEQTWKILQNLTAELTVEEYLKLIDQVVGLSNTPINSLEQRIFLYKNLSVGMNFYQTQGLLSLLKDFNIPSGEEDLPSRFMEYLESILESNADAQSFLLLFNNDQGTPHFPSNHPLVLAAVELHNRSNPDSDTIPITIEVKRSALKENPIQLLKAFMHKWKTQQFRRDFSLAVTFTREEGEGREAGIDAGGLSRNYLFNLYEGLAKKLQLPQFRLGKDSEKKQSLEDLGKLFAACYFSQELGHHFSKKLVMGFQIPEAFFRAMTSLKSEDLSEEISNIPIERRMEVLRYYLIGRQQMEEGELSPTEKLLTLSLEELSQEEGKEIERALRERAQQYAEMDDSTSSLAFTEMADLLSKILNRELSTKDKDSSIKILKEKLYTHFPNSSEHVATAQALAKGMCFLVDEDFPGTWDRDFYTKDAQELSDAIQGKFSREDVADAIAVPDTTNPVLAKKGEWLKEWVLSSDTPMDLVKGFVLAASGTSSIPKGRNIELVALPDSKAEVTMELHTCAYQIDCQSQYLEVQSMGYNPEGKNDPHLQSLPADSIEKEEIQKKAFIQEIIRESQGKQSLSAA